VQVLAKCLDACEDFGFHTEESASETVTFSGEACEYVDATHRLLSIQTEVAARENANLFGSLLDTAKLAESVGLSSPHFLFHHQPTPTLLEEASDITSYWG
jgi:hypothetical protein